MAATVAASVAAPQAAARQSDYLPQTLSYKSLDNPTTGDEFMFRLGIYDNARGISSRTFGAVSSLLGGADPALNFVPTGDPAAPGHASATPATNTVNLDPLAVEAIVNNASPVHSPGYLNLLHEMAHLRQIPSVWGDTAQAEGGAQAFADTVTPLAARQAGVPFLPGDYDANYADYVKQAQARGLQWILGGEFGNTAPVTWP